MTLDPATGIPVDVLAVLQALGDVMARCWEFHKQFPDSPHFVVAMDAAIAAYQAALLGDERELDLINERMLDFAQAEGIPLT